jgi:formimidoylglutamate deiminase
VNGKTILQDGRHPLQEEIVSRYRQLYRRVWGGESSDGSLR